MDINKFVEKIVNIYTLVDDICVIDRNGFIVHLETFVHGAYSYNPTEMIGRHLFDVFPSSSEENSNLYLALRTGEASLNVETSWVSISGDCHHGFVDTFPIFAANDVVGAVEVARFFRDISEKKDIRLNLSEELKPGTNLIYTLDDIITADPEMLKIKAKIRKISQYDSPVMITGSTGTGKEMVAQSIHLLGCRHRKPFISQNCAAIPITLLESILFGTEKGSYTGAETRGGLFELAEGGTLFLDEINHMDLYAQSKILKAVEEKRIMRIGGQRYLDVDVRIISGINEEPLEALEARRLKEDLYYRLSTVVIALPDLKDRKGDIHRISEAFITKFNQTMNMNVSGLSKEVIDLFNDYPWPGNVRELKNTIEGAFNILNGTTIELHDLPQSMVSRSASKKHPVSRLCEGPLQDQLNSLERQIIQEALSGTRNQTDAARCLGISKQVLKYKVEKYDLRK